MRPGGWPTRAACSTSGSTTSPPPEGGFYDVADDGERLLSRPRDLADNAEPAGTSALAGALLTYAALTGSDRHRDAAERAVAAAGALATAEPRFAGWTLAVAEAALAGPLQVAVVGDDDTAAEMIAAARASTSPGLVLAFGAPDGAGRPLLADRPMLRGSATGYVCRGFVCDLPVTNVDGLRAQLGRVPAGGGDPVADGRSLS